jgi:hypothetical protein
VIKKSYVAATMCGFVLAGCMEVTNSGAGTTNGAEPVSGSLQLNDMATAGVFTLRNLDGRTCTGSVQFDASDVHTFPLECSDGTKGSAMSTINRFDSQQTISYKLNDGETGSVVLGNT